MRYFTSFALVLVLASPAMAESVLLNIEGAFPTLHCDICGGSQTYPILTLQFAELILASTNTRETLVRVDAPATIASINDTLYSAMNRHQWWVGAGASIGSYYNMKPTRNLTTSPWFGGNYVGQHADTANITSYVTPADPYNLRGTDIQITAIELLMEDVTLNPGNFENGGNPLAYYSFTYRIQVFGTVPEPSLLAILLPIGLCCWRRHR